MTTQPQQLTCPKCKNNTFKLTIDKTPLTTTILHITCAKCGWNTKQYRPK